MKGKYSPSVNILRDADKSLNYIVTPNAENIARSMGDAYRNGIHSFTLIGSYGTGKSSFLMALENSLRGATTLPVDLGVKAKKVETIRVIGQYQSLIGYFHEYFGITDDYDGHQKVFDALFQLERDSDLLVIYLDEFGKFLEYASKHNPEKELYFLQTLAEFANDHDKEILLISTLHQNFEAYGTNIVDDSQKREWRKIKGRFKELTFNEPVEQLLFLAGEKLGENASNLPSKLSLAGTKQLLPFNLKKLEGVDAKLAPLDIVSASVLTKALQDYGQNERSLFTFLESDLRGDDWFDVAAVYDYLVTSFYSYLHSAYNPHYKNWRELFSGIERIEAIASENVDDILAVYKTVGLIQMFGSKGAKVDAEMLSGYFGEVRNVDDCIQFLQQRKLILFAKYTGSFKIIGGTDVDFDYELNKAEESVDRQFEVTSVLKSGFDFPIIQAKEVSYLQGTPRLFKIEISDTPLKGVSPAGAIDGYVNLIFNDTLKLKDVKSSSADQKEAILYGYFTNSSTIKDRVFEILKTQKVLGENLEDPVARKEFENILTSNERLLRHEVVDSMYTDKVRWFFNGTELNHFNSQRELNKQLSQICKNVYPEAPVFVNELLNKHKISSSIHTARKNYFNRLTEDWNLEDLGFEKTKFPPEKTIYQSLLVENGMHVNSSGNWDLAQPNKKKGFDVLWDACQDFLSSAREEKRGIGDLWTLLEEKPFKLKQGLIDFWVPTFLFINRGDFALYENDRFIPELNDSVLYMMTRQPKSFSVKAFEITGLRLRVFNKYREILEQNKQDKLSQSGFIESVKPFLVFYKSLNDYAKQTDRISTEAKSLRQSIIDARDPEQTFFEAIPKALRMELDVLDASDEKLAEFAVKLNDAIQELKSAYGELLNRFEEFLCSEVLGRALEFEGYKKVLIKRYAGVKEHRLLPKQKVFLSRLNSPLNDRDSWLASIAQCLLGKTLERIEDSEEEVLKDRLKHVIQELDNLQVLHNMKVEEGEEIYKLDVTTQEGLKSQNIRITEAKKEEVERLSADVEKLLAKNKNLKMAVLGRLLGKELNK